MSLPIGEGLNEGTTVISSTGSGTTTISGYSNPNTGQTDISQGGTGETQVFGSGAIGSVVQQAGSLFVDKQTAPLSVIGGLSFLGVTDIEFSDGFADNSFYTGWIQRTAGGGQLSERADQATVNFADNVNASLAALGANSVAPTVVLPAERTQASYLFHISATQLQTPALNSVLAQAFISTNKPEADNTLYFVLGRRRTSASADTLEGALKNTQADTYTVAGSITSSQNTNWWWLIKRNGDQVAFYYRTTSPTPDDAAFTLLGSTSGTTDESPVYPGLMCWEGVVNAQNSSGGALIVGERFVYSTDRGPG